MPSHFFTEEISSTFYVRILGQKISNPKSSFVIVGAKIFVQKAGVKC